MYDSGEKVEFDKQGNWKEINCRTSCVPAELIPEEIKTHIQTTFPGSAVIKLERNRRGYEVKLNNGLEVEYDPTFQIIDIDDWLRSSEVVAKLIWHNYKSAYGREIKQNFVYNSIKTIIYSDFINDFV